MEKLNERLIGKVLKHIKAFPETYNQNIVADSCDVTKKTPCGAIGCFGGWAVLLGIPKRQRSDKVDSVDLDTARDLLNLTEKEADYLFDESTGSPRKDYRIILKRLEAIRKSRALVAELLKVTSSFDVAIQTPHGYTLSYSDND
jgi:hypothetical protein